MNETTPMPSLDYTGERMIPGHPNCFAFERIYRLVADRYHNRNGIALDYGCGSGYGMLLLHRAFREIIGIDISSNSIEFARQTYSHLENVQFDVLDPSRQPFPDATFDTIFSFQVFEHIPLADVAAYLRYMWNMLKPGGVAVITTPNAHNYHGGFSGNPFHVKEYTSHELRDVIAGIIPPDAFQLAAVSDVASTRARIRVKRAWRNRPGVQLLSALAIKPFRLLEKTGVIRNSHRDMLHTENIDRVIGSYFVEIRKPST